MLLQVRIFIPGGPPSRRTVRSMETSPQRSAAPLSSAIYVSACHESVNEKPGPLSRITHRPGCAADFAASALSMTSMIPGPAAVAITPATAPHGRSRAPARMAFRCTTSPSSEPSAPFDDPPDGDFLAAAGGWGQIHLSDNLVVRFASPRRRCRRPCDAAPGGRRRRGAVSPSPGAPDTPATRTRRSAAGVSAAAGPAPPMEPRIGPTAPDPITLARAGSPSSQSWRLPRTS